MFSSDTPLVFVAIDILGRFRKTKDGHKQLLVITDLYSKLTRGVPLCTITAIRWIRLSAIIRYLRMAPPMCLL